MTGSDSGTPQTGRPALRHQLALTARLNTSAMDSRRGVVRFHGSIWELRCADGCGAAPWEDRRAPLPSLPPRCPSCLGLARPGVVWFGESIDRAVLTRCEAALACDVFLSVGTSSVVYPAAGLVHTARGYGAFTVEINPAATDAAAALDLAIAAPAERILPVLTWPCCQG